MKSEIITIKLRGGYDFFGTYLKPITIKFDRYQKCPVCGKVRRIKNNEFSYISSCMRYGNHIAVIDCTPEIKDFLHGLTACCAQIAVQGEVVEEVLEKQEE